MRNIQKKQQQIEKREQIQASWEPVVQAKNYAMHKIIRAGKKMGMFRYLMLAVLFVFLFTFHFCYHLCLQFKMKEKMAKGISLAMTVILIFTGVDITAFAAMSGEKTGGETIKTITAFQTLEEEVAQQTLAPGATENDIYFPESITARFWVTEPADESVETEESKPGAEKSQENESVSEESRQEEKKETESQTDEPGKSVEESEKEEQSPSTEESPEQPTEKKENTEELQEEEENSEGLGEAVGMLKNIFSPMTVHAAELEEQEVSLAVTWKLDTENSTCEIFDSTVEGNIYVYMPVLPEEYVLAEGVSLPQIAVTIGEKEPWEKLQEQIDALPTVEEFMAMTEGSFAEGTVFTQQQFEIYETIMEIMDAYELLSEEEQQKIDITRLRELMEYINSMTDVTAASAGQYEAITIAPSSLNGNAIRGVTEGTNVASMDDYAHFYSESIFSEGGLPNDGKITMPVSQVPYYLATGEDQAKAYDGNDCIRLTAYKTSATMDLETIGVYQSVYVLATAGGPGKGHYADFKVTLHYTDGTTDNTEYKLYDWYDLRSISGVENYYNVKRINKGYSSPNGTTGTSDGPVLHSAAIKVNPGKLLKSITFTMNGKDGNPSAMSGLYCCVFAITGATPEGVPDKPVATPATKQEGDTSGAFTANWNPVSGATGYVLDVSTNRNFTQMLSGYNNQPVGNVTSYKVEGNGVSPDVTYYYRVRAVNEKGQSLSSNRIATDLPIWLKNALDETDYDKVSYDAESNTVTIKNDIALKETLVIPEQDTTTIKLEGNNILAPEGKSAIAAGGKDTKLSLVSTGEKGSIKANGTDSDGNGIAAIDFSNADGESTISVSNNDIIGSNGKNATETENGGTGGAGIKGSTATTVDAGKNATIKGGNGGNAKTGTGGNGGSGIEGGKTTVSGEASIAGGNGGNASSGTGGNGGTGVNGTVSSSGSGNVSGGNGGNGASAGGTGGSAGTSSGTQGADGDTHIHQWAYSAEGNVIKAICVNPDKPCSYAAQGLFLQLKVVTPVTFSGQPYGDAKVDDGISALTEATVGKILYYKADAEGKKIGQEIPAPSVIGNYLAEVTLTDGEQSATATAPFVIADSDLPTGTIQIGNMTWNSFTENPTFQLLSGKTDAVTITAADAGSGIDRISYYLSEKILTQNQVEQLGDENWTVYENSFSLKKDGDFVLYVKLTDKSGNKAYLSSGGLSIDGTAPEIEGVKDQGGYCLEAVFTVSDKHLRQVTLDGQKVPNTTGQIKIAGDDKAHVIKAEDQAGNCTEITITVYREHAFSVYKETGRNGKIITEQAICGHCGKILERTKQITAGGTTDITKEEYPMDGSLAVAVEVKPDTPKTEVEGLNIEIAKNLLEKQGISVAQDKNYKVYLEMEKKEKDSFPADDVTSTMKKAESVPNLQNGMFVDISMWSQIGNNQAQKLYSVELQNQLTISMNLEGTGLLAPAGKARTYYIIRVHNGTTDILQGSENVWMTGSVLNFKTERFSTYSIWYTETNAPTPSGGGTTGGGSTGGEATSGGSSSGGGSTSGGTTAPGNKTDGTNADSTTPDITNPGGTTTGGAETGDSSTASGGTIKKPGKPGKTGKPGSGKTSGGTTTGTTNARENAAGENSNGENSAVENSTGETIGSDTTPGGKNDGAQAGGDGQKPGDGQNSGETPQTSQTVTPQPTDRISKENQKQLRDALEEVRNILPGIGTGSYIQVPENAAEDGQNQMSGGASAEDANEEEQVQITLQIPDDLKAEGRNFYLIGVDAEGNIIILPNESPEDGMLVVTGTPGMTYQMIYEDGSALLSELLTEDGKLMDADGNRIQVNTNHCFWHWIILVLALAGTLLILLRRKYPRQQLLILGIAVVLMILCILPGWCRWDIIFTILGAAVMAALMLPGFFRNRKRRTRNA